jgi:hypothetical protein
MLLVERLPPDSATVRSMQGEAATWSLSDHLMALVVDELRVANWQRTEDGHKGRRRPKPLPRPGVHQEDEATHIGRGRGMSTNDLDRLLAATRQREDRGD